MKFMRRVLAALLAVLLMIPTLPATAEEMVETGTVMSVSGNESVSDNKTASNNEASIEAVVDEVLFNTGNYAFSVVDAASYENGAGDACFAEDGSFTINIPEANPFFPYEVQFTHEGNVFSQWFMTPDDSVEVGGHTFYVSAYFDNTVITQLSLNVAGDIIVVYPEEKEFTNDGGIATLSLLPLEEKYLTVDLSAYTPLELTKVSIDTLLAGETEVDDTASVMWKGNMVYDNGYNITQYGGTINLSYLTGINWWKVATWELIVGDADQLAGDNIRYMVSVQLAHCVDWLCAEAYTQDEAGNRTRVSATSCKYDDDYFYYKEYGMVYRNLEINVPANEVGEGESAYIGLTVNPEIFAHTGWDRIAVYDDCDTDIENVLNSAVDITDQIFNVDLTQVNSGFQTEVGNEMGSTSYGISLVAFNENNEVIGFLPIRIRVINSLNYIRCFQIFKETEEGWKDVSYASGIGTDEEGHPFYTLYVTKGDGEGIYRLPATYYKADEDHSEEVTAAYVGKYASIEEAATAGAADIKDILVGEGYVADYSQGVYFSVFVGTDDSVGQEVYCFGVKTESGGNISIPSLVNSASALTFTGLKDSAGLSLDTYIFDTLYKKQVDSYAQYNYVTILVDDEVDLTKVAPEFSVSTGAKVYAEGSSMLEVSGASMHDFSNGAIQYTVVAEDGIHSQNYWLQIVKAKEGSGKLYINSLADLEADTTETDDIIYSTRQVMLDSYHSDIHNIWVANIGTEAIKNLSVELVSDVVELDEYWTLSGNYDLAGFTTVENETQNGELPNMAKLTLKPKVGVWSGTEVSGTLTFKSGEDVLMVLTLTGLVGDPEITTLEIPKAVKYVPYGTVIQNSNKYDWNQVTYELFDGVLPAGMEIKKNGEIYGVPTETGEFTFAVRMSSSLFTSAYKTYTMIVEENSNENVEAATDNGYELIERIGEINLASMASETQTVVSQGEYAEFVAVYLDGTKLVENQDYTSESGSTRITIKTQTLSQDGTAEIGNHTLGIEFRSQDTGVLKRAAQNYTVIDDDSKADVIPKPTVEPTSAPVTPGPTVEPTSAPATPIPTVKPTQNPVPVVTQIPVPVVAEVPEMAEVTYVVVAGDSLWKIATKFYGDGNQWQKIYADNASVIDNADVIYVGQVLTIYLSGSAEELPEVSVSVENTYTVEAGDSLWKIAQKLYGSGYDWRKIYQENKKIIADPAKIFKGQVLVVPEN